MGDVLIIRAEQRDALKHAAQRAFETEMVRHCFDVSPRLCKVLGEEQVRLVVRSGISSARTYGFTNRGPVRLFIEMILYFGSAFPSDPQYPWASEILQDDREPQMDRADRLYERVSDYFERVHGPDNRFLWSALKDLTVLAHQPLMLELPSLSEALLEEMERTYPEKVSYVGDASLRTLFASGTTTAKRYGFTEARQVALVVVLMFAFGHRCDDDPLYPWIHNTLENDAIVDAASRARRLEKKALTWLDHVLAPTSDEDRPR